MLENIFTSLEEQLYTVSAIAQQYSIFLPLQTSLHFCCHLQKYIINMIFFYNFMVLLLKKKSMYFVATSSSFILCWAACNTNEIEELQVQI